jgi:hypothetical protein
MPADACGFAARQSFNLPALTSGKKHAADLAEGHRIRRPADHLRDSVGKSARWWRRSAQTFYSKSPPAVPYPLVDQNLSATRNPPRCFTVSQQLAQVGFIPRFQLEFFGLATTHGCSPVFNG